MLAAAVLALGACGDDGGNGGAADGGATSAGGATAPGGATSRAQPGATGATGAEGEALRLDPRKNSEPVPKGSAPKQRYTRREPVPKERLKAAQQPVFEQSRYLCRQVGIEGLRREYRVQSSDPGDVAREVARRTYLREIRDAVYSGCLAGLASGN